MGIYDIDEILNKPYSKLEGWLEYYRVKSEKQEEEKKDSEVNNKHEQAREASKRGYF